MPFRLRGRSIDDRFWIAAAPAIASLVSVSASFASADEASSLAADHSQAFATVSMSNVYWISGVILLAAIGFFKLFFSRSSPSSAAKPRVSLRRRCRAAGRYVTVAAAIGATICSGLPVGAATYYWDADGLTTGNAVDGTNLGGTGT